MDKVGLLNSIIDSVKQIDQGQKWLDTEGHEHNGRKAYRHGLALAMETFQQVQSLVSDDLDLTILTEYTFVTQELQLCDPTDTLAVSSLQNALQSFDDAFISLKVVESAESYRNADMTYPHNAKYRIKGMPKDAFHIMCIAHKVRINNMLRTPRVNPFEKNLLIQRLVNINAAQNAYLQKQLLVFDEQ